MNRVACIGSAGQDIFFPTDEGTIIPTPEDITAQVKVAFELGGKFLIKDRTESIGGVAANVAVGLARLGIETACCSRIGRDLNGQMITTTLKSEGVDTTLVQIDPDVRSDLSAIVVIAQSGDRIIFHNRDANERLVITETDLASWDWLYISALNGAWRENLTKLRRLGEQGVHRLALNPGQHNLRSEPRLMLDSLRFVQVLILNKDEAIELLLKNKVETLPEKLNNEVFLVQTLHRMGPVVVALTDGKRGAWVGTDQGVWHAASYEPNGLLDTTGAGDAFGSGFFSAYLKGLALETCLRYGISNAGSVVGAYGATNALLTEETIAPLFEHTQATQLV